MQSILDIMDSTDEKNIPVILILLILKKAFDTVEWNYIKKDISLHERYNIHLFDRKWLAVVALLHVVLSSM